MNSEITLSQSQLQRLPSCWQVPPVAQNPSAHAAHRVPVYPTPHSSLPGHRCPTTGGRQRYASSAFASNRMWLSSGFAVDARLPVLLHCRCSLLHTVQPVFCKAWCRSQLHMPSCKLPKPQMQSVSFADPGGDVLLPGHFVHFSSPVPLLNSSAGHIWHVAPAPCHPGRH